MNMSYLLVLLLVFPELTWAQNQDTFKVSTFVVKNKSEKKSSTDLKRTTIFFYEDEKYTVDKTCNGEWGGNLYFKEKNTGKVYKCSSTCPVIINQVKGKYIVTNTLAHLRGSSQILEIENPKNLTEILSKPNSNKRKEVIMSFGSEERVVKGTKPIIDSVGIMTLGSFLYKDRLYHIVSNDDRTYLATVHENKFKTVQLISEKSIWSYDPEMIKTEDNHYIYFFKNSKDEGYLDIYENQINLYIY